MLAHRSSRMFLALSGLNLIGLLALCSIEMMLAERHWLVTIVAHAPRHPDGLLTLVSLVWALAARDVRSFGVNLPALALFPFFFMGVSVPVRGLMLGKLEGLPLRVLTYTIVLARSGVGRIAGAIQMAHPDVACLQEGARYGRSEEFERGLRGYSSVKNFELIVLSRFPICASLVHRLRGTRRTVLETVLDLNGQAIRVANVHFCYSVRSRRQRSMISFL